MLLSSTVEVDFVEQGHQYFRKGIEYVSQSKFVSIFEPEFDKTIVHSCAKREGITSAQMQARWDKIRDDAANYGTMIHNALENAELGKPYPTKYCRLVDEIRVLTSPYKMVIPEKILYLDEYHLAGTGDRPQIRCVQGGRQVVDIFDFQQRQLAAVIACDNPSCSAFAIW